MSGVRIPAHQEALRRLLSLSDETVERVLAALRRLGSEVEESPNEAGAALTRRELVEVVAEVGLGDDAEALIDALLALHIFRTNEGLSTDQLVTAVTASPDLALDPDSRPAFAALLARFLGVGAVAVVSKAFDVINEYEHVYSGARILTDTRPVFGDDPTTGPLGFIIVQTLRIDYVLRDGTEHSFFVAMDNSKLSELQAWMTRAAAKTEGVQHALAVSGVPYLEPDPPGTADVL